MRIDGPIPFHIAQAYGIKPQTPVIPTTQVSPITSIGAAAPGAETPAKTTEALGKLVAGTVPQAMDFDMASTPNRPAGEALPLYTRSADRIEAATGVQLGRTIDFKG